MIPIETELRPFARRGYNREAEEIARYARYEFGAEPEFLLTEHERVGTRPRRNLIIAMTRLLTHPLR